MQPFRSWGQPRLSAGLLYEQPVAPPSYRRALDPPVLYDILEARRSPPSDAAPENCENPATA